MGERRAGLIVLCALLVAIVLPGSAAAAAKFSSTIERDVCVAGAGKYGFGHAVLRVRIIEHGRSGANRFTYKAQVWAHGVHSTQWTMEYEWTPFEYTFPNDSASYYNSRSYTYDPRRNVYFHIVVTVRAFHNNELLFKKTAFGKIC